MSDNVFTEDDYERLYSLVFRPDYPGYKPTIAEIPNGDGKVDAEKRYAHVAYKYFKTPAHWKLAPYLHTAHLKAEEMARASGVTREFMPVVEYGALRILDYPPGAISNRHEDFDLFTVMCYRDTPETFQSEHFNSRACEKMREINPQAHLGELSALIGLGPATPHWVLPSDKRQRSIVYFAIPDHAAVLPNGITVGDWLAERIARSRTYK